jgi:hypothetical protein
MQLLLKQTFAVQGDSISVARSGVQAYVLSVVQ